MAASAHTTPFPQYGPVTRAIAAMHQEPEPPRRGFLRGLLSLPLLGGGVTLIGSPTAVAEPADRRLLLGYSEWLRIERSLLHRELFPDVDERTREYLSEGGPSWVGRFFVPPPPASWKDLPQPSSRAALVLSTVGCERGR